MAARSLIAAAFAVLALARVSSSFAAEGQLCPDPARPCPGFKPHDLSFQLPANGKARPEARSASFYAVILRTTGRCRVTEAERVEVQALFPHNKVFSMRFECDGDVENNVTYTNVNVQYGFLAVYAGDSAAAAKELLTQVNALGRFPGANIRRMQVVLVYP